MNKKIKNVIARVVLICTIFTMLLSAASCTADTTSDATDVEMNATKKTIDVPVLTEDVEFGKKITADKITTKTISVDAVSSTMVTSVDDVVGKYSSVPLYKGDYVYKGKLSSKRPSNVLAVSEIEKTRNKYIDVSQFIEPNSGKDVYAALQKLIDNNKHRTIYFPDGEYLISQPIKTSAAANFSTALYLSDNAVIKATNDWKGGNDALVKLGGAEAKNDIISNGSNYYFIGGILDGNGKARGISLDSGRESLVSKVKIINTTVGIYIPKGINNTSSDMDIEDIEIIGCGGDSKGIIAVGCDNNFVDIRISNVKTGLEMSNGNFLRGVHISLDSDQISKTTYEGTVGFLTYGNNWYYSCSTENIQTAFLVKDSSKPIIKDFSIRWTEARGAQIAFDTNASFNAYCSNGIIDFFDASTENFIVRTNGNKSGILLDVIVDTALCDEEDYKSVFVKSKVGA